MYENEIYSGDNAGNHTTGVYQSYNMSGMPQGNDGGRVPLEPQGKKSGGFVKKMLLCACLGLCFGLFGGLGLYAVQQATGMNEERSVEDSERSRSDVLYTAPPASDVKLATTEGTRIVSSDVSDMVEDVMPAMVAIVKDYTETASFWGHTYSEDRQGSGSGIIVAQSDTELVLVTNYHVVEGASKLTVTFINGGTAEAQIKGSDADMDLAVIAIPLDRLDDDTRSAITVARMGDSESLRLGEQVVAIGNALGYGQSVSGGWVSALNREVTFEDGSKGSFIQTDAAINPGNSGGALVNINGEVIGINSSKIGGVNVDGIGFAIPISAARPIIENLMTKETRFKVAEGETGYMGVTMQAMREEHAYLGIPDGMLVTDVEKGSPADIGGILRGDVITRFEGERIENYEDLQEVMQYYGPDAKVTVVVKRLLNGSYEDVELELTLGKRP
ncbi:MAG: trypsin-like peptidase domain-containing protein [bacterium]|nr:trypsin-like peptidase domain-containing protein [bacterium]MCM1376575.1 trypsin-like peptidase domain-containing protein [Muribaculum sp.]